MASPVKINFKIYQGSTFKYTLQWQSDFKEYVPITTCTNTAPLQVIVAENPPPVGWTILFSNIGGMTELNDITAVVSSVSNNTLIFNEINSLKYKQYTQGGVLIYNTPVDLSGYTARMTIQDSAGITVANLTTENGGIVLDLENSTINIVLSSTQTANMDFNFAKYDLEVENAMGEVTRLIEGTLVLSREITK